MKKMNLYSFNAIRVKDSEWIEVQRFLFSIGYAWICGRETYYLELKTYGNGYILLDHENRDFSWITDSQYRNEYKESLGNIVNMSFLSRILKLEKINEGR